MSEGCMKWMGSKVTGCQLCNKPFRPGVLFIDGRIKQSSHWCIMCEECHTNMGTGLGTGCGQKYSFDTLEKVEG